jgi:hypothetical protein
MNWDNVNALVLPLASVVAAVASAWVWLRASEAKLPPFTGDNYAEGPFSEALKLQNRRNATAAAFMAVSAVFQLIGMNATATVARQHAGAANERVAVMEARLTALEAKVNR